MDLADTRPRENHRTTSIGRHLLPPPFSGTRSEPKPSGSCFFRGFLEMRSARFPTATTMSRNGMRTDDGDATAMRSRGRVRPHT